MHIPDDWIDNPPEDIESMVFILDQFGHRINKKGREGDTLRYIFKLCQRSYQDALASLHHQEPQAFFLPSYEQALLLNSWCYGFNFPICFASNRIGKTTAFAFNGILWIFPNNPQWRCFQSYTDHLGRFVQVIPRPPLQNMLILQKFYEEYPELQGDPLHQPYESCNVAKWEKVKSLIPEVINPCWPYPPIQRGGMIWLGAPDNEFHKRIIMRRWRELLPKQSILKDSETDRMFTVTTASTTNPKTTAHEIVCKSYESEDTKWSGDAVQGIILTEGFTQSILNEVKNRITNEGFASWDYTPAEPRNTGQKVALAYKVYKGQEELPLRNYVYTKFSVRNAPEHIIPKEKKADLIRMWAGTEEGKARVDGEFFSSSGIILDKLDRDFHCLDWTLQKLIAEYPNGRFYRAVDPGKDHPTACAWGYLTTNNLWFIYRFYSKRNTTIDQRCNDIIKLSNNRREKFTLKNGKQIYREVHPYPNSELYTLTAADYHTFKDDEVTGQSYALNYINAGLLITESIHMGPEERGQVANSKLDPRANSFRAHPRTNKPPGSQIYFLINGEGVANALDKFDQVFWDRYKAGDLRGEPKDKVQLLGDDELDAFCYLVCAPYTWTQREPKRIEPRENTDQQQQQIATLQPDLHLNFEELLKEPEPNHNHVPVGFT
jgi:hypothetical protein